jgi:hypothetical protein
MKTIGTLIIAFFLSCNLAVAQDTLYVYKAGAVLYKQVVTNIDSVTFKPVTVDTVERSPVQQQILAIVKSLGLASVSSSSEVDANSIIRKGDVVGMKYYDDEQANTYDFKLNESSSNKDKMIFEGTVTNKYSGNSEEVRRTISPTSSTSFLAVDERKKSDGSYVPREAKEYFLNSDKTVDEYNVNSDGTKNKIFVWSPNTLNSLTKTSVTSGSVYDVSNITVVQK